MCTSRMRTYGVVSRCVRYGIQYLIKFSSAWYVARNGRKGMHIGCWCEKRKARNYHYAKFDMGNLNEFVYLIN
jgi:hypothetical protein